MPYLESEKFDVYAKGSEAIIRYGNFKRSIALPYTSPARSEGSEVSRPQAPHQIRRARGGRHRRPRRQGMKRPRRRRNLAKKSNSKGRAADNFEEVARGFAGKRRPSLPAR